MHNLKEKLVVNKDFFSIKEYVKKLPAIFHKEGKVISKGKNTFEASEQIKIDVQSFKVSHLLNQFTHKFYNKSEAKRAYYHAKHLVDLNINTSVPVAYMEFHKPLRLVSSLYVYLHHPRDGNMQVLSTGNITEHRELIRDFALFTAKLHKANILHSKYLPENILFKRETEGYKFYLLDIARMKFDQRITPQIAAKDFCYLNGSEETFKLFIEVYATRMNFDASECLKLLYKYKKNA